MSPFELHRRSANDVRQLFLEERSVCRALVLTGGLDVEVVTPGRSRRIRIDETARATANEPNSQLVEQVALVVGLADRADDERTSGPRAEYGRRGDELEAARAAIGWLGHQQLPVPAQGKVVIAIEKNADQATTRMAAAWRARVATVPAVSLCASMAHPNTEARSSIGA